MRDEVPWGGIIPTEWQGELREGLFGERIDSSAEADAREQARQVREKGLTQQREKCSGPRWQKAGRVGGQCCSQEGKG